MLWGQDIRRRPGGSERRRRPERLGTAHACAARRCWCWRCRSARARVSALISFVGSVTKPGGLKDQAATLNASHAPGRPWLDLAWQLFGIATALVPVALVAHLLLREGDGHARHRLRPHPAAAATWRAAPRSRRPSAAPGCLLPGARGPPGFNLTVVPEALPDVWWKYPRADRSRRCRTPCWRRSIVVGYLLRRLGQLGWTPVGRAGGQLGAARLVPPLPGHRRLHRQHGDGRGLRAALPPLGPGRAAGGGARAARHRGLRRLRAARGEGGLAADRRDGRGLRVGVDRSSPSIDGDRAAAEQRSGRRAARCGPGRNGGGLEPGEFVAAEALGPERAPARCGRCR